MTRKIVLLIMMISVAACDDSGVYANEADSGYSTGSSTY